MNAAFHFFQGYLRRFRIDLLIWWTISLATSLAAKHFLDQPGNAQMTWFGFLEVLALLWIVVRVAWAESGLATHGGWSQRPLRRRDWLKAQACFAVLAFLPPMLFRALILHSELPLSSAQWKSQLMNQWLPAAGILAIALITLHVLGYALQKMPAAHRLTTGRTVLSVLLVFLLPILVAKLSSKRGFYGGDSDANSLQLESIQAALPKDSILLGGKSQRVFNPASSLRVQLVQKLPLAAGTTWDQPGARFRIQSADLGSDRLELSFSTLSTMSTSPLGQYTMVIRYPNGIYAMRDRFQNERREIGVMIFSAYDQQFKASFLTPQFLPWNRLDAKQLLDGAELLFYRNVSAGDQSAPEESPPAPADDSDAFQRQAFAAVDAANAQSQPSTQSLQTLNILGRDALPYVLDRHPWSDEAWQSTIRPFLVRYAQEGDQPKLMEQVRRDPRMAEIFILKEWGNAVLPELRRIAKERLPLDRICLDFLARQKDPALTEDLAALAMRLPVGAKALESALRQQPGFDWPKFAREGWRRWKYRNTYGNEWWVFALWAAQEGDASALRRLAEEAARGKKWEREQLPGLIEGEHDDLMAFLRTNIDRLTFDPVIKRYRLP